MPLTIEIPEELATELMSEAEREGVTPAEQAIFLMNLSNAFLSTHITDVNKAIRDVIDAQSIDAERIAGTFQRIADVCLTHHDAGKLSSVFQTVEQNADSALDALAKESASTDLLLQRVGRLWRNQVSTTHSVERTGPVPSEAEFSQPVRDPDLVTRVRSLRGKYAGSGSAVEELHAERQIDDQRDELKFKEQAA